MTNMNCKDFVLVWTTHYLLLNCTHNESLHKLTIALALSRACSMFGTTMIGRGQNRSMEITLK